MITRRAFVAGLSTGCVVRAQEPPLYDLLLKGGHVVDPKNNRDGRFDVGVIGGKVAQIAPELAPGHARQVVSVAGYYVVPGLIDIHTHVDAAGGGISLQPDHNSLPYGVTTVVDAGSSGYGNFEAFKFRTMDNVKTRVLAWLNIAGEGSHGIDADACASMVKKHRGLIVGIKSARTGSGPGGWEAIDAAVEAGRLSGTPVMVSSFPREHGGYPDLFLKRMRPGDIQTHIYDRVIPQMDATRQVAQYVWAARKRGVLFDVGHGDSNFWFRIAVPAIRQGFLPDTISTDMHKRSIMIPRANMMYTLSKFLNMGLTFEQLIDRSTVNAARAIGRADLGHLSESALADIAVLRIEKGAFGFVDCGHAKLAGDRKLRCVLTVRDGRIVWDADGLSASDWKSVGPYSNFK